MVSVCVYIMICVPSFMLGWVLTAGFVFLDAGWMGTVVVLMLRFGVYSRLVWVYVAVFIVCSLSLRDLEVMVRCVLCLWVSAFVDLCST